MLDVLEEAELVKNVNKMDVETAANQVTNSTNDAYDGDEDSVPITRSPLVSIPKPVVTDTEPPLPAPPMPALTVISPP